MPCDDAAESCTPIKTLMQLVAAHVLYCIVTLLPQSTVNDWRD